MSVKLTPLEQDDYGEIARLLHQSLVRWYESHLGQGYRFGTAPEPFLIFPEVYETLDPGEAIVARDSSNGEILGVCFVHPRETHFGIGIVATSPSASGKGVARSMMKEAIQRADAAGKPLRLVSSLLNLDSFSLYTKLGFQPRTVFQDILVSVPETGIPFGFAESAQKMRRARADEAARLADFEQSLQGIRREQDYAFFLENRVGKWEVWVSESAAGELCGVLVISLNPAMAMLGPGVTRDEETAIEMIATLLNNERGKNYVVLAPVKASKLVQALYAFGGKNVELHIAQVHGESPEGVGVCFPTFLPESG